MKIKLKDIYARAADVIDRDGWVKGSYHDCKGHCAVGALQEAASELAGCRQPLRNIEDCDVVPRLSRLLGGRSVILWNDWAQSKDEVTNYLRYASDAIGDVEVELTDA